MNIGKLGTVTLVSALGLMAGFGCKKGSAAAVAVAPAPADLLIDVSIGGLDGIEAFANKIKPGVGAMLPAMLPAQLASVVGQSSLDGADLTKPVRLFVFDPTAHPNAFVELVSVGDATKLKASVTDSSKLKIEGNFALIGGSTEITAIAGYALGTVAKQPAPTMPMAVVHSAAVLTTQASHLEELRAQMKAAPGAAVMPELFDTYIDSIFHLLKNSDEIEVHLDASADVADLEISLLPHAGSDLAKITAAQHPSSYPLLAKLPATPSPILIMAGHVELGPYSAMWRGKLVDFISTALKLQDPALRKSMVDWMDNFTGELAAVASIKDGGFELTELVGTVPGSDAWNKGKLIFAPLYGKEPRVVETMGMKTTMTGAFDSSTHDGVALSEMNSTIDMDQVSPEMKAALEANPMTKNGTHILMAGWDDVMGMSMGEDRNDAMASLIDASRGKAPTFAPAGGIASMIALSHKHDDSMLMLFDYSALSQLAIKVSPQGSLPTPAQPSTSAALMGIGFAKGQAHLHFAVPVEQVLQMMAMMARH